MITIGGALLVALWAFGCSDDAETSSGGGANPDAGTDPDAGTEPDAGAEPDAGTDPDAATDAGLEEIRVFVTASLRTADLGGIEGADALCAEEAESAGLDGEFVAWLSTRESSVADRFERSTAPYVLVDGTVIADDWDDLVDGSIDALLNLDAEGQQRSGDVWTGTRADGTAYPDDDCSGFTSASGGVAQCGSTQSTGAPWTENITPACGTRLRLYCVER